MSDSGRAIQPSPPTPFDQVVALALATVAESSAITYNKTYQLWHEWCTKNRLHPLDLRPMHVRAFLIDQPVTRRTRQRHLAALRKLARVLALDPQHTQYRAVYEALRLLQIPTEGLGGSERPRRALDAENVAEVFRVWRGDRLLEKRNLALLALLFYTGLRRAEAAALRWSDIDLENGVIHVRFGKGGKMRDAAIVEGQYDIATRALRRWQRALLNTVQGPRDYVFCAINKADKPGKDRPMHVRAINQIIERTTALSGIEFTPHDARRTLGTNLLANQAPTADVQAQLGHSHASTTIQGYALPVDARRRRQRFKTSY